MLCELQGGYLAELQDKDEYDQVVDFITQNMHEPKRRTIVAGTDEESEGIWRYSRTGNPISYTQWARNYPRHSRGSVYNCLMLATETSPVLMYDSTCVSNGRIQFVCEIPF